MVFYTYGPLTKGWKETKKQTLANHIADLLKRMNKEGKFKVRQGQEELNEPYSPWDYGTGKPYLEIDGLEYGVSIRKMTHLTREAHQELVLEADKLYRQIMGLQDKK
jgi:hypothetical protein